MAPGWRGRTVVVFPHDTDDPKELELSPHKILTRVLSLSAGVLALGGLVAATAAAAPVPQSSPGDALDPRTYAPDSRLFLVVHATGVQKYTCQPNGTWLFTDPEAILDKATGAPKQVGTHYLNLATGRPVWEAKDGSSVEAARKASATAGPGNIPSLLLQAVSAGAGSDGDRLAETTWVQRLNTSGGVAPAGTCAPGSAVAVPYTSDYFFWRAAGGD
jgi:Protein of unknown function (DUF3455)